MNTSTRPSLFSGIDRNGKTFLAVLGTLAILVLLLNAAVPASSALHVSTYTVGLLGKYMCYAMLAMAVDLIWGYCGILSLGHSAFFTLGGYAMGMYLMREIGTRGVYGDPVLPDFMVFLNWKALPWYWHGFNMFWFAALMVMVVPGLLALVYRLARIPFARHRRVSVDHHPRRLTYALMLAFFRNDMGFGGNNGFTDFKDILGFDLAHNATRLTLFMLTAVMLGLAYIVCSYIVASRAGRVIQAVRDAESRARFIGFRVESYKLWVFVFSAVLAGIAGSLYVPQVGIINPSEFQPVNSIEVVIWVAVGGRGTLYGAVVGALLVNLAQTYFTGAFPELWLYALGAMFVLVTLFLPKGVMGLLAQMRRRVPRAAAGVA